MMNCKEIETSIWDYVEGNTEPSMDQNIEMHIKSCPKCAALERGIKSSLNIISDERNTILDPFFYTRLQAKMDSQPNQRLLQPSVNLRYAMAASFAIIGIVGGSLFGSYSAEQINSTFVQSTVIVEDESSEFDIADNSFDLTKEF